MIDTSTIDRESVSSLIKQIDGLQHPSKPRNWQSDGPLNVYIEHFFLSDFDEIFEKMQNKPAWFNDDRAIMVNMMHNHPDDLKEIYDIPRITSDERKQLEPVKQHLISLL
ncbi:hypothetical protein ACYATO_08735 [Lactobacillaceae bacterium Melli_B3]